MKWTRFMDMYSGGGTKEPPYTIILIEAPLDEAMTIFYNRFDHSPTRVTCTCCGEDYSMDDDTDLSQLTGYDRHCLYVTLKDGYEPNPQYGKGLYLEDDNEIPEGYEIGKFEFDVRKFHPKVIPLEKYLKEEHVLVISEDEIKSDEREGYIPQQGCVWMG